MGKVSEWPDGTRKRLFASFGKVEVPLHGSGSNKYGAGAVDRTHLEAPHPHPRKVKASDRKHRSANTNKNGGITQSMSTGVCAKLDTVLWVCQGGEGSERASERAREREMKRDE